MDSRLCRRLAALFLVAAGVAPAAAFGVQQQVVSIISPPPGGPSANGSSDHAALSQDNRDVKLIAYDSSASNLVSGDTNGKRDVFVLAKTPGDRQLGGRLSRVSVSSRGRQANGDSTKPAVDGTTGSTPHCIAFQSTATNLDRRDRSADSDIYVRDLKAKTTRLVSVGLSGATNASIDGRCRFVVFETQGRIYDRDLVHNRTLRVGPGTEPDQQTDGRGLAYQAGGQIWYQALTLGKRGAKRRGSARLISDTPSGTPASGVSENPSVDDHGHYVAFDSTATDICNLVRCGWQYHPPPNSRTLDPGATPEGSDANGPVSDVYLAALPVPPRTITLMALVSYDYSYNQLGGPSVDPQLSRAGQGVVFTSGPSDIFGSGIHALAPQNIFFWTDAGEQFVDGHLHVVSQGSYCGFNCPVPRFTQPSFDAAMSSRGNFVAFTSNEAGQAGETNGSGLSDVFLEFVGGAPHPRPAGR
jgi:hypothetical protein